MIPLEFLAEWTIRSSILIAGGALLLWLLRVNYSSLRAMAWAALLCGSFLIHDDDDSRTHLGTGCR
jgi:hypothetical protein